MKILLVALLLTMSSCIAPAKKTGLADCAKACRLSPMADFQDEELTCGCVYDKTRSK